MVSIYFSGIDLGSTMTKVVIIDDNDKICASIIKHTDAEHRRLANIVMMEALEQAGLSFNEISYIVATGYGRMIVPFADRQITELNCHSRGLSQLFPNVRLAIDIGGQDAKGLQIQNGKLVDFVMSDKCAAGTGRYLEVIAQALGIAIDELGTISLKSTRKIPISSTCTVFARQEVVSHLSRGVPAEDIIAGVHDAIASMVVRMIGRLKIEPDVLFTGGVAKNSGMVKALKEKLGGELFIPEQPMLSGALGGALFGKEIVMKALSQNKPVSRGERCLEKATFFQ